MCLEQKKGALLTPGVTRARQPPPGGLSDLFVLKKGGGVRAEYGGSPRRRQPKRAVRCRVVTDTALQFEVSKLLAESVVVSCRDSKLIREPLLVLDRLGKLLGRLCQLPHKRILLGLEFGESRMSRRGRLGNLLPRL